MKKSRYHIILIDDHPVITEVFADILGQVAKKHGFSFHIKAAHTIDDALYLFEQVYTIRPVDMVFLDMRLPPSSNGDIISGEDLGLKIRKAKPKAKIIVVTMYNDHYRIHNILKHIKPEGFLVKDDLTIAEFDIAIPRLIEGLPYYSKTVIESLRQYISHDFTLDATDRKLLHLLSLGIHRMKTISNNLSLTVSTIEKRKQHLKEIFNVKGGEDWELLKKARDKGFI
ncbi:response regulator [Sinomicrobium weinanense]|uniref:Response regulator transcription factor n=1 Tax=Sinomicrobium weinanense TaxID=2842200 RepID=A0A926JTN3_9FLAO|nr:response regulator [Sinomicrobium weinanense]MBC9797037.1 response regulator transcription factor [Sinomicrobium weinanense]MBU3122032.1 response regulator [Sinomicrobium weinanense]